MEPVTMTVEQHDDAVEQIAEMKIEATKAIEKGKAYKRLRDNPDFQLVYLEGYCKEYPRELAEAISENTGAYDETQLITDLKSVNTFNTYSFRIIATADAGEISIMENEALLARVEIV